jgi:hypothetical protein
MKEIIKITIALAVILGAYLIGNHQDDEKHQLKIEEINQNVSFDKTTISNLQDSIIKLKHIIDSLKVKPVNIVRPIKTSKREIAK